MRETCSYPVFPACSNLCLSGTSCSRLQTFCSHVCPSATGRRCYCENRGCAHRPLFQAHSTACSRKHIRSSNQRSKSSLLLRKTKIILTFFMSSHSTKRHFRLGKGSHFCCHKLDRAALGRALGLRTESSSVPTGSVQGLVARPHPQLFLFLSSPVQGPCCSWCQAQY